ncbi:MAG: HAMP domain-containing sensor histidine kinase [Anaerolineae bacterium]
MDTPQIDLRLDKIQQQVKHLNSIVEDVLNLSRMQSGGIEFKPAPGDLSALCRQVVDDFESQTAHQGRVIYTCPSSPVISFYDGRLLRQTITNLVSNGLKYAPVDTPVHLTLVADPKQVIITVEDQIGIPAEDLKRLFEPFIGPPMWAPSLGQVLTEHRQAGC